MFRRKRSERDFRAEIDAHIENETERLREEGLSEDDARARARRSFGNMMHAQERFFEAGRWPRSDQLLRDLGFGLRMLTKSPGFSAVAVITLALGIGANIAVFSMVNALLLHPYNFRDLDQLVQVWESRGLDEGYDARWISAADAEDLRVGTQVFDQLATYSRQDFNFVSTGIVQVARGCAVSANFFNVLGVAPALGRTFTSTEEQSGADQVVIVSHAFWQRRFAGDRGALGRAVRLNGRSYKIVGVTPQGFDFPVPVELWVPLALGPAEKADRRQLSLSALGRLKPSVSVEQAGAALEGVSQRLRQEYPETNGNRTAMVQQLRRELYLYTLPLFLLLQAAAAFVLALTCANLGNLYFARMVGREKEIAVRTALGADRVKLTRMFLGESLVLFSVAGLAAILVSFWSVKLLRTSISPGWTMWVPGWDGIQINGTVLAFTILLAVIVGTVCGLIVALHAAKVDPYSALKEAGRGLLGGSTRRLRSALVASQVMFALVLLVCAGLMGQAFMRLTSVYQGFQPAGVLRLEIDLPEKAYTDPKSITAFYQRVLHESAALPGVNAVALVRNSPASNVDNEVTPFTIEGRPTLKASEVPAADLQISSPDYFRALHIPLVTGQVYSESNTADTARVVVISRSMAQRFWPKGDALGQRIKLGVADASEPWMTVIGVVEDVRQNWWKPAARPTIYKPFLQAPRSTMVFLLRATSDPTTYTANVRDIVRGADAGIAVTEVNTLENEITDSIAIVRIMGVLMAVFGCVAIVLASLGVYGMLAEAVTRQTREIGIRLALGAEPRNVMRMVLGNSMKMAGIGLAIGVPVTLILNHTMASLIFGIVTMNVGLLVGSTLLLLGVAVTAAYIPARRAMRVDPTAALRYE
jgi:putative ABC transport system permease protein